MREIRFRGKRVDNGEWVYGSFIKFSNGKTEIHTTFEDEMKTGIITSGLNEVIYATVGQFTGLTDKNGKEIYEGDIVVDKSWQNEKPQVVTWESRFLLTYTDGYGVQRYDYTGDFSKKFEVIGNIHDNPELLK
jgi:uncharacterized phage protein (TIGR01671 family)